MSTHDQGKGPQPGGPDADFRQLFDLTLDLLCIAGADGYFKLLNPAWERVLGHDIATLCSKPYVEFVHPDDREATLAEAERMRTGNDTVSFQNRYRHADGSWRWLQWKAPAPTAGSDRIWAVARDVTEERQNLDSLRASEARWRSLSENIEEHLMLVDLEGRILEINRTVPDLTVEQVIGRPVFDFMPESAHESARSAFARVRETCKKDRYVTDYVTKTGQLRNFESVVYPIVGKGGALEAMTVVAADVTERHIEDKKRQAAQRLESVGHLAGGVAHDFNNLLTVIRSCVAMASQHPEDTEIVEFCLDQIRDASTRGASLTTQLLAFARRQPMERRIVDVNQAIESLAGLLRRLIGDNIEFTTKPDASAGHIDIDVTQFEQVVVNLAVNARDAMPEGGKLTIETRRARPSAAVRDLDNGEYVVIDVTDTGVGMSPEIRERAFEPFFTTKEPGKGTGLGLATSYGIVNQHGGSLSVNSQPGVGSTFSIWLPLSGAPPVETGSPTTLPGGMRGNETILLVEDEDTVRTVLRRSLERLGYRILQATDGEQALDVASRHKGPIDLVVTDVVMPRMGGPELARRMLEARPDARVLFMSGYPGAGAGETPSFDALNPFLRKPFEPTELALAVRRVLDDPEG